MVDIGQDYYDANKQALEEALVKGGVRLAAVLDHVMSQS